MATTKPIRDLGTPVTPVGTELILIDNGVSMKPATINDAVSPKASALITANNAVYDPQEIADDAFDRANHTGTQSADTITDGTTNKAYTGTEQTKLAGIEEAADVTDATNVAAAGAAMASNNLSDLGDVATALANLGGVAASATDASSFGFVIDEDDMASDSDTKVPTQQSVKAYNDNRFVTDRTALKAMAGSPYAAIYLFEAGRVGIFGWDSSDLSAEVTADTQEGIYLAPTSDATGASGAWVRQFSGPVNLRWFGATGDGSTDDSASIQGAYDVIEVIGGGTLYVPKGDYKIATSINLPAVALTTRGDGIGSRFFGAVDLFVYSTSLTDADGVYVTQNFVDLCIDQTGDGTSLTIIKSWISRAVPGPYIQRCYFWNSSATTTTATAILISGMWAVNIFDNMFFGVGLGGGPTTGIGGYGVKIQLGDDFSTTVMGVKFRNNRVVGIAWPYWVPDRTLSAGGRCEGHEITCNSFSAGYIGIKLQRTLASVIVGNSFSAYDEAIQINGDFDWTISSNGEIDGVSASIHIVALSTGVCDQGVITGNNIRAYNGNVGILLDNSIQEAGLRSIVISGNFIGGTSGTGTGTGKGIEFSGSYACANIVITSNIFQFLDEGIDFGSASPTSLTLDNNQYRNVVTRTTNVPTANLRRVWATKTTVTLTGGAATETVTVAVPTDYFSAAPAAATISSASQNLIGVYVPSSCKRGSNRTFFARL